MRIALFRHVVDFKRFGRRKTKEEQTRTGMRWPRKPSWLGGYIRKSNIWIWSLTRFIAYVTSIFNSLLFEIFSMTSSTILPMYRNLLIRMKLNKRIVYILIGKKAILYVILIFRSILFSVSFRILAICKYYKCIKKFSDLYW